jgi:opacity protein-like surface antigen
MRYLLLWIICWFETAFVLAQNPALPARNRGTAISVELVAPILRHFTFGYERELWRDVAWETKLGVVFGGNLPLNLNKDFQQQGVFVKTGLKFFRNFPANAFGFQHHAQYQRQALEGSYIKPEVIVGYFNESEPNNSLHKNNTFSMALMLNFGRQYAFGKRLRFYYEAGLGYALSNEDMTRINQGDKYRPYGWYYSHVGSPNAKIPIAFSVGLGLGYALSR